jgi:hypothetical protein
MTPITSIILDNLDRLQFAYRPNRSTDDAISIALHTALSHLDKMNTYVRMLFIDYSSMFNSIVPSKLVTKLRTELGLNTSLRNWILDFLTGRPQGMRVYRQQHLRHADPQHRSPQECLLIPLLYSLYNHDSVATNDSNSIIKFADDMTMEGLISNGDETAYSVEVTKLAGCHANNLSLKIRKTKELILAETIWHGPSYPQELL